MQIHQLKRENPNKKEKIVGRGGKRGKTSGHGTKGQNARAGAKKRPEMRDIIKRIPKLRGYRFKSFQDKPVIINLLDLENNFSNGDKINPQILVAKGVVKTVKGKTPEVKILSDGEITKKLMVYGCAVSEKTKEKIEKAGGKVATTKKAEDFKIKENKKITKKEVKKEALKGGKKTEKKAERKDTKEKVKKPKKEKTA